MIFSCCKLQPAFAQLFGKPLAIPPVMHLNPLHPLRLSSLERRDEWQVSRMGGYGWWRNIAVGLLRLMSLCCTNSNSFTGTLSYRSTQSLAHISVCCRGIQYGRRERSLLCLSVLTIRPSNNSSVRWFLSAKIFFSKSLSPQDDSTRTVWLLSMMAVSI